MEIYLQRKRDGIAIPFLLKQSRSSCECQLTILSANTIVLNAHFDENAKLQDEKCVRFVNGRFEFVKRKKPPSRTESGSNYLKIFLNLKNSEHPVCVLLRLELIDRILIANCLHLILDRK